MEWHRVDRMADMRDLQRASNDHQLTLEIHYPQCTSGKERVETIQTHSTGG